MVSALRSNVSMVRRRFSMTSSPDAVGRFLQGEVFRAGQTFP